MGVCCLSSHEVVMTGGLQKSWTHSCRNDQLGKVRYPLGGGGVKEEEQSPCLSWSYCFVELSKGESLLLPLSPLLGASQKAE